MYVSTMPPGCASVKLYRTSQHTCSCITMSTTATAMPSLETNKEKKKLKNNHEYVGEKYMKSPSFSLSKHTPSGVSLLLWFVSNYDEICVWDMIDLLNRYPFSLEILSDQLTIVIIPYFYHAVFIAYRSQRRSLDMWYRSDLFVSIGVILVLKIEECFNSRADIGESGNSREDRWQVE